MLILTSSNNYVTPNFVPYLPKKPSEMRLTFIPTDAEVKDSDMQWIKDDRQALVDAGFQVTDLDTKNMNGKEMLVALYEITKFVFDHSEEFRLKFIATDQVLKRRG